jgi:hypothetical protein
MKRDSRKKEKIKEEKESQPEEEQRRIARKYTGGY